MIETYFETNIAKGLARDTFMDCPAVSYFHSLTRSEAHERLESGPHLAPLGIYPT